MPSIQTRIPAVIPLRALQSGAVTLAAHYSALAQGANAICGARFRVAAHSQVLYSATGSDDVLSSSMNSEVYRVALRLDPVSDLYWVGFGCTALGARLLGTEAVRVDVTLEDLSGTVIDGPQTVYGGEIVQVSDGTAGMTYTQPGSELGRDSITGYAHLGWGTRLLSVPASDRGSPASVKIEAYGVRVYSIDVLGVQTGEL